MSCLETSSRRAMDLGDLDQEKEISRAKGENEKVKLRNSVSSFHWLSSSIFTVRLFACSVVCPALVTPPLISTI